MGILAVALLRIPNLQVPKTEYGMSYRVEHRGDCSTLFTMNGFRDLPPDEHALALRHVLGGALDGHDDAKGILFFPDDYEPRGQSYDALVSELANLGVWAPRVGVDHVPDRFTQAAPGTFEAMVFRAIQKLGPEGRAHLDIAEVLYNAQRATPHGSPLKEYRAHVSTLEKAMGKAFVKALEPVLEKRRSAREAQARSQDVQVLMPVVIGGDDSAKTAPKKTVKKAPKKAAKKAAKSAAKKKKPVQRRRG